MKFVIGGGFFCNLLILLAPQVGLEPTTLRLTVRRSVPLVSVDFRLFRYILKIHNVTGFKKTRFSANDAVSGGFPLGLLERLLERRREHEVQHQILIAASSKGLHPRRDVFRQPSACAWRVRNYAALGRLK
jgi:hypothetical protein